MAIKLAALRGKLNKHNWIVKSGCHAEELEALLPIQIPTRRFEMPSASLRLRW